MIISATYLCILFFKYQVFISRGYDRMVVGFTTTCALSVMWVQIPLITRCIRYNIMW
jgi:hypothetical protein